MTPLVLLAWLAAPAPVPPGLCYEQVTQTTTGAGTKGPALRTRVCALGRRMRLESLDAKGSALVLLLDEGRGFRLDASSKVAMRVNVNRLREQSQLDLSAAGEALGAAVEGSTRTAALSGTKTVAGRACRGYRITAPQASLDLYVADLGGAMSIDTFAEFLEWSGARLALGPVLEEMKKLPGFPLETRARAQVHGQNVAIVTTVTKIEMGAPTPGLFEVPEGYQWVEQPAAEDP